MLQTLMKCDNNSTVSTISGSICYDIIQALLTSVGELRFMLQTIEDVQGTCTAELFESSQATTAGS